MDLGDDGVFLYCEEWNVQSRPFLALWGEWYAEVFE